MKEKIKKIIQKAVNELQEKEKWEDFKMSDVVVDYAKNEKFGDYSSNVAMISAGKIGKNPMKIAEKIVALLNFYIADKKLSSMFFFENKKGEKKKVFEKIEAVKPGYINFYLSNDYWQNLVAVINEQKEKFGNSEIGKGKKVLLEFISANPTGPIHLGNGRGGPLGDTLANVLIKAGWQAEREFYVNDYGGQIEALGHSILKDKKAQYRGEYIDELAIDFDFEKITNEGARAVGEKAAEKVLKNLIQPTCEKLGVNFDRWFSEKKELHNQNKVDEIIRFLKEKKFTYEERGALWYESSRFGDDKDRVLVKKDGEKTYIATDLAYHKNKLERGFDKLINIQGADHHKEAEVVRNFVEKILGQSNKLGIILNQFVRIIKDGREVKMSKRAGTYFALDDLLNEVGKDAVRFIFLSYSPNTHINFDINLAKERSEKNPVYYVQYAHARINSILVKSQIKNSGIQINSQSKISDLKLDLLIHPKELSLIKELNKFPELVEEISESYEAHRLPQYAIKLADKFHSFYASCRVLNEENSELSAARLNLVNAVKIVLEEVLKLMGVEAPKKM